MVGAPESTAARPSLADAPGIHLYGTEAGVVAGLPGATRDVLPGFTEAMVRFAVRHEHARTVEDVLARRSRSLFLDARAAAAAAGDVAGIMLEELGPDFPAAASAAAFRELALAHLPD